METMVGSHKHKPAVGGVPSSTSGGGLPQTTTECTKSTFTVRRRHREFMQIIQFNQSFYQFFLLQSEINPPHLHTHALEGSNGMVSSISYG